MKKRNRGEDNKEGDDSDSVPPKKRQSRKINSDLAAAQSAHVGGEEGITSSEVVAPTSTGLRDDLPSIQIWDLYKEEKKERKEKKLTNKIISFDTSEER
jgi:hypothetical protein